MTRNETLSFEIYIMDLCEHEGCKTAKDYENLAQELHEAIENAIQDVCLDEGIDAYEPSY